VLDLTSLGLKSYKNAVYLQIAADSQSRAAVETLSVVTRIDAMLIILVVISGIMLNYQVRAENKRLLKRLSEAPPNPEPRVTVGTLRQRAEARAKSAGRHLWAMYVMSLVISVGLVSSFVSVVRHSYINSADAHYHQMLRIVSPYLDAREQAEVESDFAQISSREDYVKVLARLESQCKAHERTIPKFDPW
jgi:hypothetical protein